VLGGGTPPNVFRPASRSRATRSIRAIDLLQEKFHRSLAGGGSAAAEVLQGTMTGRLRGHQLCRAVVNVGGYGKVPIPWSLPADNIDWQSGGSPPTAKPAVARAENV